MYRGHENKHASTWTGRHTNPHTHTLTFMSVTHAHRLRPKWWAIIGDLEHTGVKETDIL